MPSAPRGHLRLRTSSIMTRLRPNISFVTLGVEDLQRSRDFYCAMGLQEHPRSNDHVAFFDMGGQLLALFPRNALATDVGVSPGSTTGLTTTLSQNVRERADIDRLLQHAAECGGRILQEASAPPWGGVRGYFADPDGFTWEIAWNPATVIDEDGRVRLGGSED
ncbi:MAG: glyoxalase [Phycisphaerae bacterium]|nr:glyoxalase [Phycisphaerae bacterium]HBZ96839.1 glyoxalase [Phycisphaerales bacterium]